MGPSRSLRSRKKQTRLEFHPLSSSSPAKDTYSQAVRDRLASVRVQGIKKSLRNSVPDTADDHDDERSLPTPQPTSPAALDAQAVRPSSPLSSLRTSPALPPRFADIHQVVLSDDDDEDEIVPPSSKRRKLVVPENRFDNDDKSPTSRASTRNNGTNLYPIRSRDVAFSTPSRKSSRLTNKSSVSNANVLNSSPHVIAVEVPTSVRELSDLGASETSDEDDNIMATQPAAKRRASKQTYQREDPFIVDDDDDHEYGSSKVKTIPRARPPKVRHDIDDFVVDNDEIEYISSKEQTPQGQSPSGSQISSTGHQLAASKKKPAGKRARKERKELEDDLLDLQDSEQAESIRKSRTRGGPVTTQRDKAKEHFELLKRRRAGERAPRVIESSEDDHDEYDDYDGVDIDKIGQPSSSRVQVISDDAVSPEEDFDNEAAHYVDDEDDFVVEDTATKGRFGRPSSDIPLQFTSFASAKPRELFPHIIEWLVKNKLSPAFDRRDDVYNMSFSRLDDQVKAQAGSRLISSAWNATFKYAILARPTLHVEALPGLDEDLIRTCDACNKSNHPARYDFTFSGKAYSKDTLEPINDSDDEEEDDDDAGNDNVSYDDQGHILASDKMHFYLGRFCAANAEMGHKLTHWKHNLNKQVLTYLEEQGVLSAEAIVNREKLNKKKREKEAERIVDMMQETGMIAELWQGFQDDLDDARIGMEGHQRKGGRSKQRIGSIRVQRDNGGIGEWTDGGKFRHLPTRFESDSEGE